MKRLNVRPSRSLLIALLLLGSAGFTAAALIRIFELSDAADSIIRMLHSAGLVIIALALFDYLISKSAPPILLQRRVPGSVSVNKWTNMTLTIKHHYRRPVSFELCDLYSNKVEFDNSRLQMQLMPGETSRIKTRFRALSRGDLEFSGFHIRLTSFLKLWQFAFQTGEPEKIKVYPDFEAIVGYTLLATDNHASQLGIRIKPKRGEGLEFLQLREYRAGDTMRQIDWKATSRRQQLISKEYRDERDQQIVLLIDSGRQMRTKDGTLSHFDHALNASLLLSYIALRQGDAVSAMSFGNMKRWISANKGAAGITAILNSLYDLHSGVTVSDYVEAARDLIARQRKRSLVVLITNTRGEQIEELATAVNLLRKRHLVLLANIHEQVIAQVQQKPVRKFEDALRYTAITKYLQQRKLINEKIRSRHIYTVDCEPQQLAIQVANSYLAIKRAGTL